MHLLQSGVPFNVIALWLGHGHEHDASLRRGQPGDEGEGTGPARSP
ncbi:hypothetical protein [Thauera humireducens]